MFPRSLKVRNMVWEINQHLSIPFFQDIELQEAIDLRKSEITNLWNLISQNMNSLNVNDHEKMRKLEQFLNHAEEIRSYDKKTAYSCFTSVYMELKEISEKMSAPKKQYFDFQEENKAHPYNEGFSHSLS